MASLPAYPQMMRRDRKRLGLRECRAAWLLGLTVRDYGAPETGDAEISADFWSAWSTCSSGRSRSPVPEWCVTHLPHGIMAP
jgi:hypothetical protein